jgi:hypothetical protein
MRRPCSSRSAAPAWGRLHRACAGVETGILDHPHLRGQVFVAFADFFADPPQALIALRAMLLRFRKIVLDALVFQRARQRLASAPLAGAFARGAERRISGLLRPQPLAGGQEHFYRGRGGAP